MSQKFQRKVEDFVCEHCGAEVKGNGYTNHCPKCLWCKHVDVFPGDRKESCGGMMEPIRIEHVGDRYDVIHRCVVCGVEKRNRVSSDDDFNVVAKIAENFAKKETQNK